MEPKLVDENGELVSDVIVRNVQQLTDCQREVMQVIVAFWFSLLSTMLRAVVSSHLAHNVICISIVICKWLVFSETTTRLNCVFFCYDLWKGSGESEGKHSCWAFAFLYVKTSFFFCFLIFSSNFKNVLFWMKLYSILLQVAQETHHRIDQCIQFNRANALATVAVQKMQCEEQKLLRMNTIPATFDEALAAQIAHKHFQHVLEVGFSRL